MSEVIGRVRPKGDGAWYRGLGILVTKDAPRIGDTALPAAPIEIIFVTSAGAEPRANVDRRPRVRPWWRRAIDAVRS